MELDNAEAKALSPKPNHQPDEYVYFIRRTLHFSVWSVHVPSHTHLIILSVTKAIHHSLSGFFPPF